MDSFDFAPLGWRASGEQRPENGSRQTEAGDCLCRQFTSGRRSSSAARPLLGRLSGRRRRQVPQMLGLNFWPGALIARRPVPHWHREPVCGHSASTSSSCFRSPFCALLSPKLTSGPLLNSRGSIIKIKIIITPTRGSKERNQERKIIIVIISATTD